MARDDAVGVVGVKQLVMSESRQTATHFQNKGLKAMEQAETMQTDNQSNWTMLLIAS